MRIYRGLPQPGVRSFGNWVELVFMGAILAIILANIANIASECNCCPRRSSNSTVICSSDVLNLSSLSGRIVSLLSMLWHKKKYFFLSSIRPYIIKQSTAVYAQQMCINNHQEGGFDVKHLYAFCFSGKPLNVGHSSERTKNEA